MSPVAAQKAWPNVEWPLECRQCEEASVDSGASTEKHPYKLVGVHVLVHLLNQLVIFPSVCLVAAWLLRRDALAALARVPGPGASKRTPRSLIHDLCGNGSGSMFQRMEVRLLYI